MSKFSIQQTKSDHRRVPSTAIQNAQQAANSQQAASGEKQSKAKERQDSPRQLYVPASPQCPWPSPNPPNPLPDITHTATMPISKTHLETMLEHAIRQRLKRLLPLAVRSRELQRSALLSAPPRATPQPPWPLPLALPPVPSAQAASPPASSRQSGHAAAS